MNTPETLPPLSMQEVLRLSLRLPPPSFRHRLESNPEVAQAAGLLRGNVAGLWTVDFEEVGQALAASQSSDAPVGIEDHGPKGGRLTINRADGTVALSDQDSSNAVTVALLALMDGSVDVRRLAFESLARDAPPALPREGYWRQIVANRPLTAPEIRTFLGHLNDSAHHRLARVSSVVGQKPRIGPEDLVPDAVTYYESLIGPAPSDEGAPEYLATVFLPHVKAVAGRDLAWGWRLARFAFVGPSVDVGEALRDVSDDDLFSLLQERMTEVSPFAVVAELVVALARAERDERFAALAHARAARFNDPMRAGAEETPQTKVWTALFGLTLRRISTNESTWATPPYWRRLAAFVHAHLLVDAIDLASDNLPGFADWCNSVRDDRAFAAGFIDHQREPLHDPWELDGSVELLATGYALRLTTNAPIPGPPGAEPAGGSEDSERSALVALAQLRAATPDLLAGGLDGTGNARAAVDVAVQAGVLSRTPEGGPDAGGWRLLVHLSKASLLGAGLLDPIRQWVLAQTDAPAKLAEVIEVVGHAATIASTQSDLALADAVVDRLMRLCEKVESPAEVRLAWSIVMIAAAAQPVRPAWRDWLSERLTQLAHAVPRGMPCAVLASALSALDAMLPFDEQVGSRAAAVARAGAD